MTHNAHITARLLAGRPVPLLGRLLADITMAGAVVPLDPETGGEIRDDRPAFVLSTEGEASDGHIIRQHWHLGRATGAGIPVLWNHNQDILLGQWQDLSVQDVEGGRALVGRAYLDPKDDLAQHRRRQIRDGLLSAVSTGWIPGESVRRGELDPDDPLYREPVDGFCGPEEGLVMGSEASPNVLIEASIVPCPAQESAVVIERLHGRAERFLAERSSRPGDLDALLGVLGHDPKVRAYLRAAIRSELRELTRADSPVTPTTPSVLDILRRP